MNPRLLLHLEGAAVLIVSLLSLTIGATAVGFNLPCCFFCRICRRSATPPILGWERSRTMPSTPTRGHWFWLVTRSGRIALRLHRSPSSGSLTSALIECLDSG
jgi:hypothetical protein